MEDIFPAFFRKDLIAVTEFIDNGTYLEFIYAESRTPLMNAVIENSYEIIDFLINTGARIDGPHKASTHKDPRALNPHGHVPGHTNPDGTPWLPIY